MSESDRVTVEKDGERIEIHPLALPDHQRLGWTLVETPAPAAPEAAPKPEKKRQK